MHSREGEFSRCGNRDIFSALESIQHGKTGLPAKQVLHFTLPKFTKHVIRSRVGLFQSEVNWVKVHLGGGYGSYKSRLRVKH